MMNNDHPLRISIIQTDISWENKQDNLRLLHRKLKALCGTTEIVVLPEMFSTGFSMNSQSLAEPTDGTTITTLRQWATTYGMAIAGSYIALGNNGRYYNRAFFLTPDGEAHYYDKRHLFRMGHEPESFAAGEADKQIIAYRGWNIRLLICYDLRFPVWSRNTANEYDLLIYVANWPESRRLVWDTLLRARALENMCYVCGVNRIGTDANQLIYKGGSILYSPKGDTLATINDGEEAVATTTLSLSSLHELRKKFPVWKDADLFELLPLQENKC
ncbi:MAG: amidohydrolase [Bacteroides sp.]|nr:amidohydrolase [Bacteroides sp.]